MIVIEHNMDVIKCADHVIDLDPLMEAIVEASWCLLVRQKNWPIAKIALLENT